MTRLPMRTRVARPSARRGFAGTPSDQAIRRRPGHPSCGHSGSLHTWAAVFLLGVACAGAAQGRDGADIYARHCIQCHSIARMTELLPTLGTPDTLRERLRTLLPIHHAPDPREHEQLLDYLMTLRREP